MDQEYPEFFSPTLHADRRYIVAVTDSVRLETRDDSVTMLCRRGLYAFGSRKAAERFVNTINNNVETEIAHLFDTEGKLS